MARLRGVTVCIVLALLATTAAPCVALVSGEEAALASCQAMGHDDRDTGRLAESCCQTGDATQHDRDIQPATARITHLDTTATLPALRSLAELPAALRLGPAVPQTALFAISPARHCPLLI